MFEVHHEKDPLFVDYVTANELFGKMKMTPTNNLELTSLRGLSVNEASVFSSVEPVLKNWWSSLAFDLIAEV